MRLCSASSRRALLELVDRNLLQQRDRVVVELAPQHRIELAEQARRVGVPAPPQVLRQRGQTLMRRRDELPERPRLADDRRQLRAGRAPASARRRASKTRGSMVCTTRTPCSSPRSMTGTPRNERYGSSPASGKYLKRGCVVRVGDDLRPQLLGDQAGQALR